MIHSVNDDTIDLFLDELRLDKSTSTTDGTEHSTYQLYRRNLECYDDWLTTDSLDAETYDIKRYLRQLNRDGYSGNTISSHFTAIRKFYSTARDEYRIPHTDPCNGIKIKDLDVYDRKNNEDKITYIDPDEVQQMVQKAQDEGTYIRDRLMIDTFFQTGLRKNELRLIELDRIDQDTRQIRVYGEKNGKWRTVHYQPSLNRGLSLWIESERPLLGGSDSKYLFAADRAPVISPSEIKRVIRRCASDINEITGYTQDGKTMWKITPHTLRHSYAMHALQCGVNIRAIQKQLGHEDIETTLIYLDMLDDDVSRAHESFDA